jgi:hypothetical protein
MLCWLLTAIVESLSYVTCHFSLADMNNSLLVLNFQHLKMMFVNSVDIYPPQSFFGSLDVCNIFEKKKKRRGDLFSIYFVEGSLSPFFMVV